MGLLIFKMCYCAAARLGVGKSSDGEGEEKEHAKRERREMGHSLPAFDEARRVSFYTSSIGACTACNPTVCDIERGDEWG
jgi:hypothetical protein